MSLTLLCISKDETRVWILPKMHESKLRNRVDHIHRKSPPISNHYYEVPRTVGHIKSETTWIFPISPGTTSHNTVKQWPLIALHCQRKEFNPFIRSIKPLHWPVKKNNQTLDSTTLTHQLNYVLFFLCLQFQIKMRQITLIHAKKKKHIIEREKHHYLIKIMIHPIFSPSEPRFASAIRAEANNEISREREYRRRTRRRWG